MSTSVSRAPRGQQCPSLGAGVGPLLLHLQEPCTFSGGGAFGGGHRRLGGQARVQSSFPIEVFLLPVQLLPRSLSSSMWVSFHNFKRLEILSMGASPIPGHRYLAHFVPSSQTLSLVGFFILFLLPHLSLLMCLPGDRWPLCHLQFPPPERSQSHNSITQSLPKIAELMRDILRMQRSLGMAAHARTTQHSGGCGRVGESSRLAWAAWATE